MHHVAKIFFFFAKPSNAVLLIMGIGLLLMWRPPMLKLGRAVASAGFVLLLVAGFSPLGNLLIEPLEQRFARPAAPPAGISGIILLGGFEDGLVSRARGSLAVNEAAERVMETLLLSRALPEAKVIFSGGVASILLQDEDGGDAVASYLRQAGVASERIVIERDSRNTYENAIFTRELVKPKPGDRWLLVTSAFHMPRSMGIFRQAGYDVVAWPVDYRTRGAADFLRPFDSGTQGLERIDTAVKEWIGLVAYRLMGRTNELWPSDAAR